MRILSITFFLAFAGSVCIAEIPVEHEGEGCFQNCERPGEKTRSGPCSYCGDGGLCCRQKNKEKNFIGNGCNGKIGGQRKHECVVNPLWKPPVTDCSTDETACDNNTNDKTACFNDDCVAPVTVNDCANDDTACDDNTNGLTVCVNRECTPPAVEVISCTGDSTACNANTNGKTVCTWNPADQYKKEKNRSSEEDLEADLCYDTGTVTEATLKVGLRVKRGQDWEWNDEDGNGLGTVMQDICGWSINMGCGQLWSVKWDNNGSTDYYRVGYQGKYDLKTA